MNKSFFTRLFPALDKYGMVEIREIDPVSGKSFQKFFHNFKKIEQYQIPENRNVYFGRGYKKKNNHFSGESNNCIKTNVLYLDFDQCDYNEVINRIYQAELPGPTIIVNSGGGYHVYWILNEPINDATDIVKAMIRATGSDPRPKDKARLFRVPGSLNHKYDLPRKCEIVYDDTKVYKIEAFNRLLPNLKIERISTKKNFNPPNIKNTYGKRICVDEMLKGVPDGFRHFSLGRITKFFQLEGYRKDDVRAIVLDWNQRNRPLLPEKEIMNCFYKYWHTDYKLLGCNIPDPQTQAKLSRFCSSGNCNIGYSGSKLKLSKTVEIHNKIFEIYSKLPGRYLIVLGLLLRHPNGLTRNKLRSKLTNKITGEQIAGRDSLHKAIKKLNSLGLIEVVPKSRKTGTSDFIKPLKKGTFGLGYTLITNGAVNGVIDGRISPAEFKVYVLLNKTCINDGSFPSMQNLADKVGCVKQAISQHVKALEQADYIERNDTITSKGFPKFICRLLV